MNESLPYITEPTGMFPKTSKSRRENTFQTNCKLCRGGVHREDPSVWLTDPMGLSHTRCAVRAGLVKEELCPSAHPAEKRVKSTTSEAPLKMRKRPNRPSTANASGKGGATASTAPTA